MSKMRSQVVVPRKEFGFKPVDRIKRESKKALMDNVVRELSPKNIFMFAETEEASKFSLNFDYFTPAQMKDIIHVLTSIKNELENIEHKGRLPGLLKDLCDCLRG